jgi:HEAT repeat protein
MQRAQAAMVLGLMGDEAQGAIPVLLESLREQDQQVRRIILAALSEIGPPARNAVPALVACLRDRHELVRRRAALALGELGPAARTAVPALLEALRDRDLMVRRWAAFALGEIGSKAASAAGALVELMREPSAATRSISAVGLTRIGAEAVSTLIPALKDADAQVRRLAASILGKCGGDVQPRLIALQAVLADADPLVRQSAHEAIERLRGEGSLKKCQTASGC